MIMKEELCLKDPVFNDTGLFSLGWINGFAFSTDDRMVFLDLDLLSDCFSSDLDFWSHRILSGFFRQGSGIFNRISDFR